MAVKPATKPTNGKSQSKVPAPYVASTALSVDVGHKAMGAYREQKNTDAEISLMQSKNRISKYETLQSLTEAFAKAAIADKSIVLEHVYSEKDAEVNTLRDKLNVAVGIKTATVNEDGTTKLTLAPWTAEFIPEPGAKREGEEWRAKETFRTNFAQVFKKAMMAAATIVNGNLKTRHNKDGLLMVSGPAIKARFNVDEIALNEKREVETGNKDAEGKPVVTKLAKIPSYTELARISAEQADRTLGTRVQSGAKLSKATITEKDVLQLVDALMNALGKIKGYSDEVATKLEALQDAIETSIDNNEGTEAA